MDKTTQWKIQEILRKVTPLDLETVKCKCGEAAYTQVFMFKRLSRFHKDNTMGKHLDIPTSVMVCVNCGTRFNEGVPDEADLPSTEEGSV